MILAGCGCVGLIGFVLLAAILFPVFSAARQKALAVTCASHLKQQGLALLMYSQDSDERLPPADPWMDLLTPYMRDEAPLRCPVVTRGNPTGFGYAFNAQLSRKPFEKIDSPQLTPMVFESTILTRNAFDAGKTFAATPPRHGGGSQAGAFVVMVDGSVQLRTTFPTGYTLR
jgi:hypothetical protein